MPALPQVVVIDNGSYTVKAGVSGEDIPRETIMTLIGRPRHPALLMMSNIQAIYHGENAFRRRGIMGLRRPIQGASITNFDDVEALWTYIYKEDLQLSPSSQPVLMTDSPLNNSQDRSRMAQVAFETLNVPALNISNTASLALYACGRTTGVVVDSGEEVTHIVPIQNGIPVRAKTLRMDIGGRDLAESVASSAGETLHVARDILAKTGYIVLDYPKEVDEYHAGRSRLPEGVQEKYELPHGGMLAMNDPPFKAAELLFQPALREYSFPGVHNQVQICIASMDPAVRHELYSNIVLSGGSSLVPGLPERLAKEMTLLAEDEGKKSVEVVAMEGREIASWTGGSILANLDIFESMLASKQEWEEFGDSIVHRKFVL